MSLSKPQKDALAFMADGPARRLAAGESHDQSIHYKTLDTLIKARLAKHLGEGWYGLTPKGESALNKVERHRAYRYKPTPRDAVAAAIVAWAFAIQGDGAARLRAHRHATKLATEAWGIVDPGWW